MADLPFLFDAVVFDLDGTLVATDRFWVDAARAGARRAFQELGIERAMPSAMEWMSLVGLPLAQGFDRLFADLPPTSRALVFQRCVEEENTALRAGQAALLPGVADTLASLRARGVRLGIASNCGADYLHTMMHELGLARWVEEGRCLDSPNVRSKSGMVADLLDTFGTRAAVMVGDRIGDRDAAWQNGLPHVHCARGFAQEGEQVECEAVIEDMSELVPRLERRAQWIGAALESLGFGAPSFASQRSSGPNGPRSLGVTGHSGSGKTLFARDVHRVLAARGVPASVVALGAFLKPEAQSAELASTAFVPADRALDHLVLAFDVEDLEQRVLGPHQRGERVDFDLGAQRITVEPGTVLVLEGLFLSHPRLRPHLDRIVHLAASDNLCLRRIAGRDARDAGPESLLRVRRHFLPTQRGFDELVDPARAADLVLDAENALGSP
jgi:phosphoglycolate phosphatase